MDKKSKVRVRILGSEYTFVGTESEEYIKEVCGIVNMKLEEFCKSADLKPIKAAVLASVNFCDEATKAKKELEPLSEEIKTLRAEMKALEEENIFLKDEIKTIRKNNDNEQY